LSHIRLQFELAKAGVIITWIAQEKKRVVRRC
jgi:hypothetical protein